LNEHRHFVDGEETPHDYGVHHRHPPLHPSSGPYVHASQGFAWVASFKSQSQLVMAE
jgi:hypothetical protein